MVLPTARPQVRPVQADDGVGDSGEGRIVARPELDFQGSDDGETWQSYIFRCDLENLRLCHCHAPLSRHA